MKTTFYFDNAATTFPKPEEVYAFMDSFYRSCGVNVGRGQHKLASIAHSNVDETRDLIRELFHCPTKEVVFTHTATEAINLILNNVVRGKKNIYISPFEHNAVTRTLHHLQSVCGFDVLILPFDISSWTYDFDEMKQMFLNCPPDVMVVSHASNVCGHIAPYEGMFAEAKKCGCITVLDMCQTAGLIDTNLNNQLVDYAVFDGHKTLYGPLGIAGIVGGSFANFEPLIYGGTGVDSANPDMPSSTPERFEAGSVDILALSGLNAALKWIKKTGIDNISAVEIENRNKLLAILKQFENISVFQPDNCVGVISCVFDGYSSDNIGQVLSDQGVLVRTGLHCSPLAHQTMGTYPAGTVRFSVSYFTSEEDFAALNDALEYIENNA